VNDRLALFGGRRFVLAVLVLLTTAVLRWFEHLDNGSFTAVLIASVCAYIAGDTWQRHGETKADVAKTLGTQETKA
jgi:hypothetical protein